MYDFDMKNLLATFNGDPDKLAKAFTDQLNKALEEQKQKEKVQKLASNVALTWDSYVDEYLSFNNLKLNPADYHLNGEDVEDLLMFFIALLPEMEKTFQTLMAFDNATNKVKDTTRNVVNKIEPTLDEFEKAMKQFFKKNDI